MTASSAKKATEIVSASINRLMNRKYARLPNKTAKISALAKESGVGTSTIQRILDPETYGRHKTRVDTLESLAAALGVEAFELLKSGTGRSGGRTWQQEFDRAWRNVQDTRRAWVASPEKVAVFVAAIDALAMLLSRYMHSGSPSLETLVNSD